MAITEEQYVYSMKLAREVLAQFDDRALEAVIQMLLGSFLENPGDALGAFIDGDNRRGAVITALALTTLITEERVRERKKVAQSGLGLC